MRQFYRMSLSSVKPDRLLAQFAQPPGALGEIIDWICGGARRPNRVLALGAALVTVGTLIGRRAATPTRSGTHLYVANCAPVAAGKDRPLNCVSRLLTAAGAGAHFSIGDLTAQTALNPIVKEMPLGVIVIDDIADFLSGITGPKANRWERGLGSSLRSLWGKSFGCAGLTSSAAERGAQVNCPAISLFGASTREAFWEVLQGARQEWLCQPFPGLG